MNEQTTATAGRMNGKKNKNPLGEKKRGAHAEPQIKEKPNKGKL